MKIGEITTVWLVLVVVLVLVTSLVGSYSATEAQQQRPYEVYRIPKGCLYVAGTRQTGMALAFVPDDERGPCDVGTTPIQPAGR